VIEAVATSKKTRQGLKLGMTEEFHFESGIVATSKKTRQGLKQRCGSDAVRVQRYGCNEQENPTGIETASFPLAAQAIRRGCNEQENPTGIETNLFKSIIHITIKVATSKKTRQGLKQSLRAVIPKCPTMLQRARKPDRD